MTETMQEAVARLCTHRCSHFPSALIHPDVCARRLKLIHKFPSALFSNSYWYCEHCPGPFPADGPIPKQKPKLVFEGHELRVLFEPKERTCKCRKCGETDPDKFDPGRSRRCGACVETYKKEKIRKKDERRREKRKENPRQQCVKCGRNMNAGMKANHTRLSLGLCGECFAVSRRDIKNRLKTLRTGDTNERQIGGMEGIQRSNGQTH